MIAIITENEIEIIHSIYNNLPDVYVSEYRGLDVLEFSEGCPEELVYYIIEAYIQLIRTSEIPEFKDVCCECIDYFYGICLEDTELQTEDIADEFIYDVYISPYFDRYYELFEDLIRDGLSKLKLTYSEEYVGFFFDISNEFIIIYNDAQKELLN